MLLMSALFELSWLLRIHRYIFLSNLLADYRIIKKSNPEAELEHLYPEFTPALKAIGLISLFELVTVILALVYHFDALWGYTVPIVFLSIITRDDTLRKSTAFRIADFAICTVMFYLAYASI